MCVYFFDSVGGAKESYFLLFFTFLINKVCYEPLSWQLSVYGKVCYY